MAPRINIPPVTRALIGALLFQSLLGAAIRYRQWSANTIVLVPYLVLVPQLSIIYPWTFASTTLVEGNVFTLAIAVVTLYQGGRYLERAWSGREFAKFLLVVSLIPNTLCFVTLLVFYTLTRREGWMLTPISGTVPLQIAFLIAFSQLVPAHTVTVFRGIISMRVPRFPLLYIGTATLLSLTPLLSSAGFFLAIYGFLTSWTYLRFFKPVFPDLDSSQPSSLRGDASETFAFAEFFPASVKPAVATIADQIYLVLIALRVCAPFSSADVSAARGDHTIQRGTPGSARAEAERRRALALKALDQRLNAAAAANSSRGPSQQQPSGHASSPSTHSQSQPGPQTAMTSQPGPMLGETNYDPDNDGKGDS